MLLLDHVGNYLAEHPESICGPTQGLLEEFYRRLTAGAYEARAEDTERLVRMPELRGRSYTSIMYYQIFPKPNLNKFGVRMGAAALNSQPFNYTDAIRLLTRLHSCVQDIQQQLSDDAAEREVVQAAAQGLWLDGGLLVAHTEEGLTAYFLRRSYLSAGLNAQLAYRALHTAALYGFLPRQS